MEQPSVREVSERIESLLEELGRERAAGGDGPGRGARAVRDEPVRRRARAGPRDRRRRTPYDGSPTTSSWATCWCSTTCTPTTSTPGCSGALDQVRPYLGSHAGGVSLSGRRRERRRPPPARGQLRRLPVVGADRQERDRGRHAGGRARRRRGGGRGHGRAGAGPGAAPDRAVPPHEPGSAAGRWPWTSTCRRARCRASRRGDDEVVVANLDGTLVAYVDRCPACLVALSDGTPRRRSAHLRVRPSYDVRHGRPAAGDGGAPPDAAAAAARARRVEGRGPAPGASRRMTGLGALRRIAAPGAALRPRPRSGASSAPSRSTSGTGTWRTSPTTGCCASAGPATSCSGLRAAGGGRYRGVGEEVRRVEDLGVDEAQWDALRIPVDLVFFFRQTAASTRLLTFYPGPGGATESRARPERLGRHRRGQPGGRLDRGRRRGGPPAPSRRRLLLLPRADRRLLRAGRRGRLAWTGLGGGSEVWQRIDELLRRLSTSGPSRGGQAA